MKIIKPSVEEFIPQNPIQHIERCGRVCYKSEDKITDTSAEKFVAGIVRRGHLSVTEHFRFIVEVSTFCYNMMLSVQGRINYPKDIAPSYLKFSKDQDRCLISGSARGFYEFFQNCPAGIVAKVCAEDIIHSIIGGSECSKCLFPDFIYKPGGAVYPLVDPEELTTEEAFIHGWHTLKFTCDRGVSHELVRHRPASFSQESTRYCNYSGDKFGNELTFIQPCFWEGDYYKRMGWSAAMQEAEKRYMSLLVSGATPQEARSVLPNSLKTELVITATNEEWLHILKLRCSKAAHPQAREVCDMAKDILKKTDPEIYGGL